ncbi:hypothetical protein ACFWC9_27550 [Streptomyces goshikiensis]|uniref:hypothetical protein n=1 Tax=Streptomyces goshikiensis TaxID=1942 RepID=UPI0036BC5A32
MNEGEEQDLRELLTSLEQADKLAKFASGLTTAAPLAGDDTLADPHRVSPGAWTAVVVAVDHLLALWAKCEEGRAVPGWPALAEHFAGGGVQRGEQVRDAVPDIVVGARLGGRERHRQHRLGPVQRLHLRLLIDRQDHRTPGRAKCRPTMSATFCATAGSLDSLKVPDRKDFRFSSRQIRATWGKYEGAGTDRGILRDVCNGIRMIAGQRSECPRGGSHGPCPVAVQVVQRDSLACMNSG